jgi:hypothetical protein
MEVDIPLSRAPTLVLSCERTQNYAQFYPSIETNHIPLKTGESLENAAELDASPD